MGKISIMNLQRSKNLKRTGRKLFKTNLACTWGIKSAGLWNINAATSSEPFKFVATNLKNCRVSLNVQVCSPKRWISIINSLSSVDLLLSTFKIVIVPDAFNPRDISESAIGENKCCRHVILRIQFKSNRWPYLIDFYSRELRYLPQTAQTEKYLQKTRATKSLFPLRLMQHFSMSFRNFFYQSFKRVFIQYICQKHEKWTL